MSLQYIFPMAISTNLFATQLLFCVSVKFELAMPFSPFLFLHLSLCGTVLTWGWSKGTGVCTTGLGMPPWKRRHRNLNLNLNLSLYHTSFAVW